MQNQISEYTAYVYQILAQILQIHPSPPAIYMDILPMVLAPTNWLSSVLPALTQLTCAFIARMPNTSTLEVLSIIQKLIAKNEQHAMLLLSILFKYR